MKFKIVNGNRDEVREQATNLLWECLKEFKKFLLPKDWAKDCVYLNVEPEEYVISKYLSKDALSLILKASKNRIWDF